ncbi:MAG: M23 family metallopeptidase [Candidatus Solibacter sp.]|nr:M23 family metallopeptidase [Candidatus Solibacter sp.]
MKAIIAIVLLAVIGVTALFVMSSNTVLTINPEVKTVGITTPVTVKISNPHGVRRISTSIEQGGARFPLTELKTPAHRFFWRRNQASQTLTFDAGKSKAANLKEGDARIVVEAEADDLAGHTDTTSATVKVVRYTFRSFPLPERQAGVKVGRYTFRSFPLPGRPEQRFAMFAYPWDLAENVTPMVFARNLAGTESTGQFWFKLFPKKFRTRDFPIDDALMSKLVNQIDPGGTLAPGPDMLSRFLKINGEMRRRNNQQLADLRLKTEEKVLWNGPFLHWGKEESMFADVRSYLYMGKKVDQQVHLGFDLSDTANAPVHVANDGRVVWAADLGIYGNCVVVDHGYALQSIYGHMNRIDVKVGDLVKKNQSLGVAGATGLAGGVHVHFSMQIDGVQVNPREWWDEHWIHDRIMSKLDPQVAQAKSAAPKEGTVVTSQPRVKARGQRRK